MDLGLKELGATFIVGAFALFSLEIILSQFFKLKITEFFREKILFLQPKRRSDKNGEVKEEFPALSLYTLILIGSVFAIGILAEDISYKYVDSFETPFTDISYLLQNNINILPSLSSKDESRVETLIIKSGGGFSFRLLAVELAKKGAFTIADSRNGPKMEHWIMATEQGTVGERPSDEEINSAVENLYYYAKNRMYLNPTYYDEMRKIELRRDFSRSIALVAVIYFFMVILLTIFLWAYKGLNHKYYNLEKKLHNEKLETVASVLTIILGWKSSIYLLLQNKICPHQSFRKTFIFAKTTPALIMSLILFSIYLVGMWSFVRESDEYNKRAFGYFSSMLIAEEHELKKSDIWRLKSSK